MATKLKKEVEDSVFTKVAFTKEQILKSAKYASRRDLLNGLLVSDKTYTLDDIDKLLYDYRKGEVI